MKKKKPRAKSYQEINRALDAALAKRGEPKLTFRKGTASSCCVKFEPLDPMPEAVYRLSL